MRIDAKKHTKASVVTFKNGTIPPKMGEKGIFVFSNPDIKADVVLNAMQLICAQKPVVLDILLSEGLQVINSDFDKDKLGDAAFLKTHAESFSFLRAEKGIASKIKYWCDIKSDSDYEKEKSRIQTLLNDKASSAVYSVRSSKHNTTKVNLFHAFGQDVDARLQKKYSHGQSPFERMFQISEYLKEELPLIKILFKEYDFIVYLHGDANLSMQYLIEYYKDKSEVESHKRWVALRVNQPKEFAAKINSHTLPTAELLVDPKALKFASKPPSTAKVVKERKAQDHKKAINEQKQLEKMDMPIALVLEVTAPPMPRLRKNLSETAIGAMFMSPIREESLVVPISPKTLIPQQNVDGRKSAPPSLASGPIIVSEGDIMIVYLTMMKYLPEIGNIVYSNAHSKDSTKHQKVAQILTTIIKLMKDLVFFSHKDISPTAKGAVFSLPTSPRFVETGVPDFSPSCD